MNTIKVENNKINNKDVEKIINLDCDTIIYYINCDLKLDIVINKDIKLLEYIDNSKIDNNYIMNSNLCFNRFSINSSIYSKININVSNIKLNYFYSTINKDDNIYKLDVIHNKENTHSKVINHGLNFTSSKLEFIINGIVLKNSYNVLCNQDSKIIIMGDNNSIIKPNLIIDNDDIEANHSAYIGRFNEDEIFYIMSRGINRDDSIKLLAKSFLLNNVELEFNEKDMVLKKIDEYWR